MELITEGNTKLWVYKGKISKQMEVFYNPAKKFDRDTNVELVKILKPKKFLDLLKWNTKATRMKDNKLFSFFSIGNTYSSSNKHKNYSWYCYSQNTLLKKIHAGYLIQILIREQLNKLTGKILA